MVEPNIAPRILGLSGPNVREQEVTYIYTESVFNRIGRHSATDLADFNQDGFMDVVGAGQAQSSPDFDVSSPTSDAREVRTGDSNKDTPPTSHSPKATKTPPPVEGRAAWCVTIYGKTTGGVALRPGPRLP